MRLSIIVRNNLEKEGDGSEYHAASSSGAPSGDVKLNHTDAELDFEEQSPDGTGTLAPLTLLITRHCCLIQYRGLLNLNVPYG